MSRVSALKNTIKVLSVIGCMSVLSLAHAQGENCQGNAAQCDSETSQCELQALSGAAKAQCRKYCDVLDCGSPESPLLDQQCRNTLAKYKRKTSTPIPCGDVPVANECPCVTATLEPAGVGKCEYTLLEDVTVESTSVSEQGMGTAMLSVGANTCTIVIDGAQYSLPVSPEERRTCRQLSRACFGGR